MWSRRLAYGGALLAALICQLFDVGYLVHFAFVLTLCLPLAGLLASLPAMLGCRVELRPRPGVVERDGRAGWDLVVKSRSRLPIARLSGRLRVENRMTGERWAFRTVIQSPRRGERQLWGMGTARCGALVGRLDRLWVTDCLGLFALPVRPPAAASALVCPKCEGPGPIHLPEGTGAPVPAARRDSRGGGEDYELRPYREGDDFRSIHWKATARRDELVVREELIPRRPLPVLTFDHFGSPAEVERTLDRVAGWSAALLARDMPHEICWAEPETGAARRFIVSDQGSWMACLTALLSDRAPQTGQSILDQPPVRRDGVEVWSIRITGEEGTHGSR